MAHTLSFFMSPEDELAFLRALEPFGLRVYPEAFDRNYQPWKASAAEVARLVEPACYLAVEGAGEPACREIRRGPHARMFELDEVRSPVFHWERSLADEDGTLRSGRIWAELEALGDRQRLIAKHDLVRKVFDELRAFFRKRYHHSTPAGYFVGATAARLAGQGLLLREAGRKGAAVKPYR